MPKDDKMTLFYEQFSKSFSDIESENTFPEAFYKSLLSGKNTVYQKDISETKKFDETWIKTVESYFPSIDKITKNPKSGLFYEEDVIAIEKVKKINSKSIRHLSSHSHLIKEVQDDGFVIPKKLLTSQADIEYATYENRFIMTLVKRLSQFVKRRYKIIKENVESFQRKHLNFNSSFKLNKTEVNLDIDLVLKDELDNEKVNEYNYAILGRVEHLNRLVNGLMGSSFMELLKKAKDVHSPIMKTNIILKNIDFQNAYLLWIFLERYNNLEYDTVVKEKNLIIDDTYLQDLYKVALTSFSIVSVNQKKRKQMYDELLARQYFKKSTQQIKFNIDDQVKAPDPIQVDDHLLNEYFLQETKRLFDQNLEKYLDETKGNFQVSLKHAIRDTMSITNNLYSAFFELKEGEKDIFRLLVKDVNYEEDLKDATKKARIARIIREVKESDYKKAVRLEESLHKDIAVLNRKILKDERKETKNKKQRIELEEKIKYNDALAYERQKKSDEYKEYIEKENVILKQLRDDINYKLKEDKKIFDDYEKEEIRKAESEAKEYYDKEIQKIKDKLNQKKQIQKEKNALKMKKELQREKEAMKLQKDKEKALELKKKNILEAAKKKMKKKSDALLEKADSK